jgi:hypothetical protein
MISLVMLLPTAEAVGVEIIGLADGQKLTFGGTTSLTIKITINAGEQIPVDEIRVIIDSQTLRYTISGTQITSSQIIQSLGEPTPTLSSLLSYNYGIGYLYGYGFTYSYGYGTNTGSRYNYDYGYGYGYGFRGPISFTMTATLNHAHLTVGTHQIRVDIVTGLSPRETFSSATITFEVLPPPVTPTPAPPAPTPPPPGVTQTVAVTTTSPVIDASATTGVVAKFSGLVFTPGATGEVKIIKITGTPTTEVTVQQGTGNQPVTYVDVQVVNIIGGQGEITVSYNEADLAGVVEETLTLHYFDSATSKWVQLSNIQVDTVNNTVTGTINVSALTGTIIAVNGKTVALQSVAISGQGTTIEVLTGETVTFTVTATKTDGTPAASIAITPLRNGVALSPVATGSTGQTTFTLVIDTPGTYAITARGTLDQVTRTSQAATLRVLSRDISAALIAEATAIQPGQSIRVTLALTGEALLKQGTVTFLLPVGTTASNITPVGFPGDVSVVGNAVVITKSGVTAASRSAAISFTLTAPIREVKVGQVLTVTAIADIDQLTTKFTTDSKIVLTINRPTVSSIFSVLDSFFDGRTSVYTESRIPTVKDIFTLLDLFFAV